MTFRIPYTFIPGTKAKAGEVNSNFTKISDYLQDLKEEISETTENLADIEKTVEESIRQVVENKTRYCVNSSETTLLSYSDSAIYFAEKFILTDLYGESTEILNYPSISCKNYTDGTYNIFIGIDKTHDVFKNNIYRQKEEPSAPLNNDIWVRTTQEPISALKYTSGVWEEYDKIPIGSFIITNTVTSSVSAFPYNQNGYNINTSSTLEQNIVNNLLPQDMDYVVSRPYNTSSAWVEIWKSGKIRQGGKNTSGAAGSITITYLVPFKTYAPNPIVTAYDSPSLSAVCTVNATSLTGFTVRRYNTGNDNIGCNICWFAEGK